MRGKAANLTLSDLAALNKDVKDASHEYDNLQVTQKQKKITATPAVVAQESKLIGQLMKANASSRLSQSQLDAKLSTACAYVASTLFSKKTDTGYEQGVFIPYYVESAVLSQIQEHLAISESNILAKISEKQGIPLNSESASKNIPLINLQEVRGLLAKINSQITDELQKFEAGAKGGVAVTSLTAAQEKVDKLTKEILKNIDKEIKKLMKEGNPILVCQRLKALSQEIAIIQKELARYHIDVNEVVIQDGMKSAQFKAKLSEFEHAKTEVLANSELSESLKALVQNADPKDAKTNDDFINDFQAHLDEVKGEIAAQSGDQVNHALINAHKKMQDLLDAYKDTASLARSDEWRQEREYIQKYNPGNAEIDDKEYLTGRFNPVNKSIVGTLASDYHRDQIRTITTSAAQFVGESKSETLSAESLDYIKSEYAAHIETNGLSILMEHHKSKLTSQSGEGWAQMQKNVSDMVGSVVSAIIHAAGDLPLTDISGTELDEILDEKVKKVARPLDPVVRRFIEENGVRVMRDAIENAQRIRDEKVKQDVGGMSSKNDKLEKIELLNGYIGRQIKSAWDNKNQAKVEEELEILSASVGEQNLSDPQRNIVATKIAENLIRASGLTNTTHVAPNATLKIAVSREVATRATQATERVTQHMESKSQAPPLPPMRDKSTIKLSTKENVGKKVLVKGPNMSWTKRATIGAPKERPATEENIKRESSFRMK